MKNSLSYTLALWVIGLVSVAVAGWGTELHASGWLQAFSTFCLGYLVRHLGLIPADGGQPAAAPPAVPAAPGIPPAPAEPPVPPAP